MRPKIRMSKVGRRVRHGAKFVLISPTGVFFKGTVFGMIDNGSVGKYVVIRLDRRGSRVVG